jgi:plasmid stabilization system protein ParE
MVPVIYAPEAERDLDGITAYIAHDNPKAAEQFGYRLIARAELLGTFPRLGRPVHGKRNVRVLLESPVQIYYRLGHAGRSVEILRFWHASRDPNSLTMD